jgi:hypothetical protein
VTVGARYLTGFSDEPTKVAGLSNIANIAFHPNDERFGFPRHSASDKAAVHSSVA